MKLVWFAALLVAAATTSAAPAEAPEIHALDVRTDLAWLFPLNPPSPSGGDLPSVDSTPVHLSNSRLKFTDAQLHDLFFAPDWHPETHSAMPDIVLHGRPPGAYACGYCHLPGGQGRPENAALAGLPSTYIIRQVADIKSGARRSAWHDGSYLPVNLMRDVATHVTDSDMLAAGKNAWADASSSGPRMATATRNGMTRCVISPSFRPAACIAAALLQ